MPSGLNPNFRPLSIISFSMDPDTFYSVMSHPNTQIGRFSLTSNINRATNISESLTNFTNQSVQL